MIGPLQITHMTTTTYAADKLHRSTAQSFSQNVLRAMHVAAMDDDGEPKKMTQQELADRAQVGRSTIAKYSAPNGEAASVNPDLDTICRLAGALNVSPAFLLMTPADWSHLAQAVMYFSSAVRDEKFVAAIASMFKDGAGANARSNAATGLGLAKKFGLYNEQALPPEMPAHYAREIGASNQRIRNGILAMSALPPSGELKRADLVPLLSLCAIMGAHLRDHDEQE